MKVETQVPTMCIEKENLEMSAEMLKEHIEDMDLSSLGADILEEAAHRMLEKSKELENE